MVRNGDGSVSALYSERWTAPLADEVRGALSDALQRELGALDVRVVKPASSAAVWRVQTDVQRFDLSPGAAQWTPWRVRPVNLKGSGLICRTVVDEPASGQGASALVAAQQRALSKLAGVMASAIRGRRGAGRRRRAQCGLRAAERVNPGPDRGPKLSQSQIVNLGLTLISDRLQP